MSPTSTTPTAQIIHQGEQPSRPKLQFEEPPNYKLERTREGNRPTPTRTDTFGNLRCGIPQVHPLLRASSAEDAMEHLGDTSYIPLTKGLRHCSSDDFSRLRQRSPEDNNYEIGMTGEKDSEGVKLPRNQKRVRLSSGPNRPGPLRSASFQAVDLRPRISSSGTSRATSIIKKWSNKHQDKADVRLQADPVVKIEPKAIGDPDPVLKSVERESELSSTAALDASNKTLGTSALTAQDVKAGKALLSSSRASSRDSSPSDGAQSATSSIHNFDLAIDFLDGEATPMPPKVDSPGDRRLRSSKTHQRQRRPSHDRRGSSEVTGGHSKHPQTSSSSGLRPRPPSHARTKHGSRAEKLREPDYDVPTPIFSSAGIAPAPRLKHDAVADDPPMSAALGPRRQNSLSLGKLTNGKSTSAQGEEEEDWTTKPIYRRFNSLNHRLLAHLQDELIDLEEQLNRLDEKDTRARQEKSGFINGSKRTELLDSIACKLVQYNHTLSSFTSTRTLPVPSHSAVNEYRDYLAAHSPKDSHGRCLDSNDGLVTLEAPDSSCPSSPSSFLADGGGPPEPRLLDTAAAATEETPLDYFSSLPFLDDHLLPIVTPIPGTMHGNSWLLRHNRLNGDSRSQSSSIYSGERGSSGSRSSVSSSPSTTSPKFAPPAAANASPIKHTSRTPPTYSPQIPYPPPSPMMVPPAPSIASSSMISPKRISHQPSVPTNASHQLPSASSLLKPNQLIPQAFLSHGKPSLLPMQHITTASTSNSTPFYSPRRSLPSSPLRQQYREEDGAPKELVHGEGEALMPVPEHTLLHLCLAVAVAVALPVLTSRLWPMAWMA